MITIVQGYQQTTADTVINLVLQIVCNKLKDSHWPKWLFTSLSYLIILWSLIIRWSNRKSFRRCERGVTSQTSLMELFCKNGWKLTLTFAKKLHDICFRGFYIGLWWSIYSLDQFSIGITTLRKLDEVYLTSDKTQDKILCFP